MPKLFLGLQFPDSIQKLLVDLKMPWANAHWVAPENLHLTLRYLGEVEPSVMNDLADQLTTLSNQPFELTLHTPGFFGSHGEPHTLWVGVAPHEPLLKLRHQFGKLVTPFGFKAEKKNFSPHITLARLHHVDVQLVAQFLEHHANLSSAPFAIREFHLFQSHTTQHGPAYTVEYSYPLTDLSSLSPMERLRRGLTR